MAAAINPTTRTNQRWNVYGGGTGGPGGTSGVVLQNHDPGSSYYIAPSPTRRPAQSQPVGASLEPPQVSFLPTMGGFNQWTTPHVQTQITPGQVYSPQLTQASVNQAQNMAQAAANASFLKKGLDGRGIRRSQGSMTAILPQMAAHSAAGQRAAVDIPFQDAADNAAHRLRGEAGRDAEALAYATGAARMNDTQQQFEQSQQLALLRLLSQMTGV